jgi:hypothetical protein
MRLQSAIFLGVLICNSGMLLGSAFEDLDFEQATIATAPTPVVPSDAFQPIASASALPGWIVTENSTVCNAVWGAPAALDETSVALISTTNKFSTAPIQGNFSVQLSSFNVVNSQSSGFFQIATISQTGDVPAGTKSIQFLLRDPTNGIVSANPFVTLNGTAIPLVVLSTSGNTSLMGGDASAFAGTSATLAIESAGVENAGFPNEEDDFDLDSISFSTNPLPEPYAASLIGVAVLLLSNRRFPASFQSVR